MNVPVLARTLESAGLSTVVVTNMPFWAEKIGVPRTLAVEFPFGHTLGQPNDQAQQTRVILEALDVLEKASDPGTIVHSEEKWPVDQEQAMQDWQPEEPSPLIAVMGPKIREVLKERRRRSRA